MRDVGDQYPRTRTDDGKVRILFVGRIEARKGVDLLLEAAYRVLPEFPDAELVLVGRHNPAGGENCLARFAEVTAADADLKARITFAGELSDDDLMRAYADCDVFVLPSRYESFGLVLTEAMMFGKPVVAARAGDAAAVDKDACFAIHRKWRLIAQIDRIRLACKAVCTAQSAVIQAAVPLLARRIPQP